MGASWSITHTAPILPVRDVSIAVSQYERLGFNGRKYTPPGPDAIPIYGFLERDGMQFHLALWQELDPDRNTTAVYIYVDDPDALFREWNVAEPAGCLEPPEDRDWFMREMTYVDPDGNLLRIGRPLDTPRSDVK